jgi:molecular chaperone GrpE
MMSDSRRENDEAQPQPLAPEQTEGASPSGEMVPAEQVKAALEAAADFKDRLLRTLADMENLRKRTEREVSDARQYAVTNFARDVLQVSDNMHRALDAIGAELSDATDDNVRTLVEGIELTERELAKVLEKHGVKMFTPQGEKFDPNVHQAMYEVPDGSVAPGTVAQVIQAGFMIGERILRPALVAVAKAPPKAPTPSANDNSGTDTTV